MPDRLGRYVVRRRIGSGGFATVWLAYDEQLDSPVAVKVLGDIWTEDHQIRRRFVEEGRYLRKVESPYVVSVYDAGELDDGRPYLVMSYADQGTLADRLDLDGLTPAQTMEVVRQVGEGLQALHDRGILHRDVKPANVLFRTVEGSGSSASSSGTKVRAMLGDLGLGKSLDVSSRLTMVAGTPTFVAPEQASAESPDARADQYSLAALTYLLLAGRPPFSHRTLSDAMTPAAVPSVSTPERPFPASVDEVLRRALSPAPDDRWPTVTDFVTALESALGSAVVGGSSPPHLPVDPDRTQPGPRPSLVTAPPLPDQPVLPVLSASRRWRRGLVAALVGLLALAGGVAVGYAIQQARIPTERTVSDGDDYLTVTVPTGWTRYRGGDDWTPPNAVEGVDYRALSVGTARSWTSTDSTQQGVFVGLLPGKTLPPKLPGHPECDSSSPTSHTSLGGHASARVVYSDCPGGGVTLERVTRITSDLLLWVQIRSHDQATANRVLDSVKTSGLS